MKIAVIDKFPSNIDYTKYFEFEFDTYHLCQYRKEKILKKDIDIKINVDKYDFIILIGAEAVKHFTKKAIGSLSGHIVNEKYIPLFNPAIVIFKPENKQAFEAALKRLHDNIAGTSSVDNSGTFIGITDSVEALGYLTNILNSTNPIVSLDTETTALYPRDGYVLGISICNSERNSAYILSDCLEEEHLNILQQIIDNKEIVFHNAKFDISMMQYHFNLVFNKDNVNDTLIMHYLLDETVGTHDLKSLALKYTKFGDYDDELEVFKKEYCRRYGILQDNFTYDLIPFNIIYLYAAKDAAVTYELYSMFKNILYNNNNKLLSVYNGIMIPALFLLIEMENNGIPFDIDRLKFAKEYLDSRIKQAKDSLYAMQEVKDFEQLQKAPLNTNSPVQLRKFFFDFLKLRGEGKRTGAGELSTDAEVLESLKKQHPAVDIIVTLRKLSKLKNTYVDSLICTLDKDGRIRTNFNQTTTTSGRLSSSGKFNAQQLPRDDPIIKGTIKAKPGNKIVSQD